MAITIDEIEKRRSPFYNTYNLLSKKSLTQQVKPVITQLREGNSIDNVSNNLNVIVSEEPIKSLYESMYTDIYPEFAVYTMDDIGLLFKQDTRLFIQRSLAYLAINGTALVTGVTDTTKSDINNILIQGVQDGLSNFEMAKVLAAQISTINITRALLISQTEVARASNAGSLQGAIDTGANVTKRWLATRGARTRATHVSANGQKANLDNRFMVGGSFMKYPGDPQAPIKETARCRCTLAFDRI